MIDSSKWEVIEAGLKCIQGKAHGQLDLHEGRRRAVHRAPRQAVQALRRRGGGDGLRRGRPGRYRRAQDGDLQARLRHPGRTKSASRRKTSSSTRTSSPWPPASRSTTTTRWTSSRPARYIRDELPYAHVVRRRVQRVVLASAATTRCARRSTRCSSTTPSRTGLDMGIVNAGQLEIYDEIAQGAARQGRGRGAQPHAGRHRRPAGHRRQLPGRRRGEGSRGRGMALAAGGQAPGTRTGQGHHRLHRRGHRGVPPAVRAPHRGDRRPADERHERGRRPVRRRQDVPAPGGQVGPRDEAGRGPPDPLHRGGERRQAGSQGQDPHGHREGRRARHRQEHRRRGARL